VKVVVIGYGSIGKRHVNNLISLGINDITLCRGSKKGNELNLDEIDNLDEILKLKPNFVIVSNPTFKHFESLDFLLKNQLNVLCEKPLLFKEEEWNSLKLILANYTGYARIIYNLRFHPCVKKINALIQERSLGKFQSARFFVGQYLPDWRPGTNHLESYSSYKDLGGGVVMDLIHEIDLAEYLVGKPSGTIHSISDKLSNVTNDSKDIAEVLYKTENNVLVNIHLDYLYRGYSRNFSIQTDQLNLNCDLFASTIKITGDKNQLIETYEYNEFERNDMYVSVLKDYIDGVTIKNHNSVLPSFYENESVMKTSFHVNN
jgi:predicted dehydrogenase